MVLQEVTCQTSATTPRGFVIAMRLSGNQQRSQEVTEPRRGTAQLWEDLHSRCLSVCPRDRSRRRNKRVVRFHPSNHCCAVEDLSAKTLIFRSQSFYISKSFQEPIGVCFMAVKEDDCSSRGRCCHPWTGGLVVRS